MPVTMAILDGYTVEPSGLGVPPYLSSYVRGAYSALRKAYPSADVRYLTIDDVRWCRNGSVPSIAPPQSDPRTYSVTVNRDRAIQILADATIVVVVAGKSTLARWLAARHEFAVVHSSRTPDGVDLAERYREILARPGRLALDRSFVSELVYGPLRHRGSRLTDTDAADLAVVVAGRDGLLVHLTAPATAIHARLLIRDGAAAACLSDVESLIAAYERVVTRLAPYLPIVRIDTR